MALDVETLLAPVSEEAPAGEDLSFDPGRYELEAVFETSVGVDPTTGEAVSAADVDWRKVVRLIQEQFARSKDVWLAVYLCRAGAGSGDLETLSVGAQTLAGLLEQYWETAHPVLEDGDAQMRAAPFYSLATRTDFLAPLERTPLLRHARFGAFSGADFERFRSQGAEAEGYGLFRTALQNLPDGALSELRTTLADMEQAFRRADAAFTEQAGSSASPNLTPLYDTLGKIRRAVASFSDPDGDAGAEGGDTSADAGAEDTGGQGGGGRRFGGQVDSREDVLRALDSIADYYRRREPASPMPVLMDRAKAWVNADFLTLLRDIAPDGVDQARLVLTRRPTEDENDGY